MPWLFVAAFWAASTAAQWEPGPNLSPLEPSSKTGLRDYPIGEWHIAVSLEDRDIQVQSLRSFAARVRALPD